MISPSSHNTSSSCETVESYELDSAVDKEPRHDVLGPLPEMPRQVSCSSKNSSLASSAVQFAEPSQTLIFFDWDDTLFPTTDLFDRWELPTTKDSWDEKKPLPKELEESLHQWREALYQYLSMACTLSENCTIITNSTSKWVERCIKRFAPNLQPFLDRTHGGVRVVYAETTASQKKDKDKKKKKATSKELTQAKLAAMRHEATQFYSRYPQQTWKNILSLGDMKYEHDAVLELAMGRLSMTRERLRTKAILLPRGPTLSELTLRLQFSKLMLPAYVRYNGDFHLDLRSAADPLQAIARAVGMPELGALHFPRHAWGRTAIPKDEVAVEALDELAVTVHDLLTQEMDSCGGAGGISERTPDGSGSASEKCDESQAPGTLSTVLLYGAAEFAMSLTMSRLVGRFFMGFRPIDEMLAQAIATIRVVPVAAAALSVHVAPMVRQQCHKAESADSFSSVPDNRSRSPAASFVASHQPFTVGLQRRWIGYLLCDLLTGLFTPSRDWIRCRIAQLLAQGLSQFQLFQSSGILLVVLSLLIEIYWVPKQLHSLLQRNGSARSKPIFKLLLSCGAISTCWYAQLLRAATSDFERITMHTQLYSNIGMYGVSLLSLWRG